MNILFSNHSATCAVFTTLPFVWYTSDDLLLSRVHITVFSIALSVNTVIVF